MNENAKDVMAAHRRCNRVPCLPDNSQLATIRKHQHLSAPSPQDMNSSTTNWWGEVFNQSTTQPSEVVSQTKLPRGLTNEGTEPWQIHFYEPAIHDILERAKQFSHCDAASVNAFPLRVQFKNKAVEYVEEAISERCACGLLVTDGRACNT